jgi:hypothetical protein
MLFRSIETKEAILSPMFIEHVLPKMKFDEIMLVIQIYVGKHEL